MDIEITAPHTDEEFDEYYRLRWERLRKEHGLPPGSERDHPAEQSSVHVIARVNGRVVGAACWVVGMGTASSSGKRQPYVRYRQLAVDPEFEGHGIGSALTRHIEQAGRELGASEIVGNVRMENVPFFERLGWVVRGTGETLFGEVESVSMAKPLR